MTNRPIYATVAGQRLGAQITHDGAHVAVWIVNGGQLGHYNIERFAGGRLTATTLRDALMPAKEGAR